MRQVLLFMTAMMGNAKRPHVVLMVIDDVGWDDVGYHGSDFPTPNMDKLASQGVRLNRYYVQQVCSPTRSALLSGRYPFRTGMQHRGTLLPGSTARLPESATTLAEAFLKAGYRRHAIGKWHLGYASWKYTPLGRGFESYSGYLQGQGDYYQHTMAHGGWPDPQGRTGFDFWRNKTAAKDQIGKYSMEFYMAEAQRVIDAHDPEQPLFLYFAHQEQHVPLQAPPEPEYSANCAAINKTQPEGRNRHTLCTMMSRLDRAIGDFVSMLKRKGLWEDTVMWVTADNGGMTRWGPILAEASVASNYPLRGGKATLFEGGVRVVSFVTGGRVPPCAAGTAREGLIQHVDVAATLASLGGADLGAGVDGLDVWDVLARGGASPRSEVPINIDTSDPKAPFSALIDGKWKLINAETNVRDGWWSSDPYMRTPPNASQVPVRVAGEQVMLFDLSTDPQERRNVATDHEDVVLKMLHRIQELADPANGYRDPQPQPVDPRADPRHHDGCLAPWLDEEPETAILV
mmetsp:Transcript_81438/g.225539  ORF Transcript_81438/g.225539 Transcript_81438/m.225539 type:complete len:515 (+) Transcript_81438:45-1589(+)